MIAAVSGMERGFGEQVERMRTQRLLTLREAAKLTGFRRKVLRARVTRGDVAVRMVGSGRAAKVRLTESALVEAGLLSGELATVATSDEVTDLIRLVREQQARITSLEDQRFQLAGQLGASLERTLALQDQLIALTASLQAYPQVLQGSLSEASKTAPPEPTPERDEPREVGAEDAEVAGDEPLTARAGAVARSVVESLAMSKSAQRGRAGLVRLRTVRWRLGD